MKKYGLLVSIGLIWILTACSSAPAAVTQAPAVTVAVPTTEVQPTTAAVETQAPAITEAAAATEAPAATEAATEAAVSEEASMAAAAPIYRIVPGESRVSYEVGETFLDQNRFAVAIGVTPEVNGEISLDLSNPQAASIGEITVDISQLTSDSSRRDNALRERFLGSSAFPIARFVTTQIEGLPAAYTEGQEITFRVTGDLTVREVTRPVTFDVTAKVQNGELSGNALGMIKMSDFGVGPISMAVLRTEDDVKLTLTFVARP